MTSRVNRLGVWASSLTFAEFAQRFLAQDVSSVLQDCIQTVLNEVDQLLGVALAHPVCVIRMKYKAQGLQVRRAIYFHSLGTTLASLFPCRHSGR